MTKYLTFHHMVNLSKLLDSRNKEYRFVSCKILFLLFWIHSYLLIWRFPLHARKCWLAKWIFFYFDVAMKNIQAMQLAKSFDCLNKNAPNLRLCEGNTFFLVLTYFVREIAFGCKLHDDAGLKWEYHKDLEESSMNASR